MTAFDPKRTFAVATRAGTVELHIPKLRKGSYFPTFLGPRILFGNE